MSGIGPSDLLDAVRVVRQGYRKRRFSGVVPDYEGGEVSTKVVRIVISYIDFINRVVWSKPNVEASASALDCLAKSETSA